MPLSTQRKDRGFSLALGMLKKSPEALGGFAPLRGWGVPLQPVWIHPTGNLILVPDATSSLGKKEALKNKTEAKRRIVLQSKPEFL